MDYYRLSRKSFHERIRYFELHVREIDELLISEKIEIQYDYLICLFEIGRYHKFLDFVDPLIESVIIENIYLIEGKDAYRELLTKKAACSYNVTDYGQADYILKSLINLYPEDPFYRAFFRKNVRKQGKYWYRRNKSFVVVGVLLATAVLQIDMLVIGPFYTHLSDVFTIIWKGLFLLSAVFFMVNEWKVWYLGRRTN